MNTPEPLLLMILDGWGYSPRTEGNAIASASTPNLDRLFATCPSSLLQASGEAVGLPEGQMGNSEVGHLNIGAGRVVYQDLTRINQSIRTGEIFSNHVLIDALENVKNKTSSLHIMGLFSYGGVHSHIDHLHALIKMARQRGIETVYIHAFLDGRDVPPTQALEDMQGFEKVYAGSQVKVATVSGRYYAMDRDKRWERTSLAYKALTTGEGILCSDAVSAIKESYERGEEDEFVKPSVITDSNGNPFTTIKDDDSVIFFNFRPDRARQLTYAFVKGDMEMERETVPQVHFVCMAEYDEQLDIPIAFPPEQIKNTLGEVLSHHKLKQLRIAETEKYAHVTFFFNGGVEKQNENEQRCMIPSPKVATYDLQPQMSAYKVTEQLLKEIDSGIYDAIILNFANMDMVGHTGIMEAAIKAVEAVDDCVGRITDKLKEAGGEAIIIADHGNAEKMDDPDTGKPHTAHTSNPVPCIYVTKRKGIKLKDGKLSDVSPTLLYILGIPQPEEMTGTCLIDD